MAPMVLGYWYFRGLGAPIHYLLSHVGADYETKTYIITGPPDYDQEEWLKQDKNSLGLDFPNLPYLIDGNLKLTQSLAILRYLGKKYQLDGKSEEEQVQISVLEHESYDLIMDLVKITYLPYFDELKVPYLEKLPERFQNFSNYLSDRKWFVGDDITYVDFIIYEALDHNRMLAPALFAKHENLGKYLKRVRDLPNIKKYMESDKFLIWPIYCPKGRFGGSGPMPE